MDNVYDITMRLLKENKNDPELYKALSYFFYDLSVSSDSSRPVIKSFENLAHAAWVMENRFSFVQLFNN